MHHNNWSCTNCFKTARVVPILRMLSNYRCVSFLYTKTVKCPYPPWIFSSFLHIQTKDIPVHTQESWNSWLSMAIACLLPGRSLISGNLEGISTQIHHWCPTRLSTWCTSFLPIFYFSWWSYILTFHTTAMQMTLNSPSPSLTHSLLFLFRSQHVRQTSHHGQRFKLKLNFRKIKLLLNFWFSTLSNYHIRTTAGVVLKGQAIDQHCFGQQASL